MSDVCLKTEQCTARLRGNKAVTWQVAASEVTRELLLGCTEMQSRRSDLNEERLFFNPFACVSIFKQHAATWEEELSRS